MCGTVQVGRVRYIGPIQRKEFLVIYQLYLIFMEDMPTDPGGDRGGGHED
jgi:hypothetical protein